MSLPARWVDNSGGDPGTAVSHLWRRLAARALDMFTVFFITFAMVVTVLVTVMDRLSEWADPQPWGRAFMATGLYTLVALVYEIVFVSRRGQTPGKDLLNLKVVDASTGLHPSLKVAVLRALPLAVLRFVPGPLLGTAASLVVGTTIGLGARPRAVHDYLAGTTVISYDADVEEHIEASDDQSDSVGEFEDAQAGGTGWRERYGARRWWRL